MPPWYQSSSGPRISSTILNILGNVLPILSLVLSSKGIHFVPAPLENFKVYIDTAVFTFFSIRAAIGYVKSKKKLQARINILQGALESARK